MGLMDWAKGQFIDIIEWTEPSQNEILAHRFTRHKNEIKNGAKLIVREGQAAGFVKEGQLADVKTPGMYTLDTNNMPILSTILGWKYGFESPFKCEVYFISTRQWTDQKWGTQNPVMFRDPEFGPVRLRAFGSYAFKVTDPGTFLKELVATDPSFELYEITEQFRNVIVSRFIDALGASKIPMLDLAGNYEKVSKTRAGADRAGTREDGRVADAVLRREHLAAAGGGSGAGQAVADGRPRQPRPVREVPDGRGDPTAAARTPAGWRASVPSSAPGWRSAGRWGTRSPARPAPGVVTPANTAPPAAAGGPPPLPTAVAFHASIDGAAAGPFDVAALAGHVRDREADAGDAGVEARHGGLGRGRHRAGTRGAVRRASRRRCRRRNG